MSLNLLFAGTPDFAVPTLKALHESHHSVLGVWTQPDRPAGRGRHVVAGPVKSLAVSLNYSVYQPERFNNEESIEAIKKYNPDVLIVAAYGLLLPKKVLDIPTYGCINVHASLLPRWRGASPIQYAILAGDKMTGISIMQMDAGLDTGPVWLQKSCPIDTKDTSFTLSQRLAELGALALLETLEKVVSNHKKPIPQDDALATYAPKLTKEMAALTWNKSAKELEYMVRAFNPWPVAYSHIDEMRVKIYEAYAYEKTSLDSPGAIIEVNKEGIDIATTDGCLRVLSCQLPGTKVLPVQQILNGYSRWFAKGKTFR